MSTYYVTANVRHSDVSLLLEAFDDEDARRQFEESFRIVLTPSVRRQINLGRREIEITQIHREFLEETDVDLYPYSDKPWENK